MATTISTSLTTALARLFAALRSSRGFRVHSPASARTRPRAAAWPEVDRELQRQRVDLRAARDYTAMTHRLR